MRLILSAALLLASTAALPAFAQDAPPPHQGDGNHQGDGRHEGGPAGPNGQRPGGGGQPQGQARPGPQGGNFNRGPQGGAPQGQPGQPQQARPGPDAGAYNRGPQGGAGGRPDGNVQGQNRRGPNGEGGQPGWANRPNAPGGQGGYRPGGQPQGGPGGYRPNAGYDRGQPGGGYDRGRPGGGGGGDWNRGWRGDQRYDWQGYRNAHRDFYHVDRYRAPYGYGGGYRRFGIGAALERDFFAQQYWIGDPGYYRLPPAYGPYRWVRYYNDALLVNIYSGQITDEIPDFFY